MRSPDWDLKYIRHISFLEDLKIILLTIRKVVFRSEKDEEIDVADDFGDALLKEGKVTREEYDALQAYARQLLEERR